MTIIYVVPEKIPDSRARFLQIFHTCNALANTGIQIKLVVGIKSGFSKKSIYEFYGLSEHPNLEIIRLPMIRREYGKHFRFSWHGIFYFFLFFYLLLRRLLFKDQEVLFIRHIKLAHFVLRIRKILNIPVIYEVHEIFHLTNVNLKRRNYLKSLESKVFHNADVIIAISRFVKNYLIQMGISDKSIDVIYNGFDERWLNIKKDLSSSYICYIGSLYNWKGIDTVIIAMKHLPDERLLIVGGGKRLEELKNLARSEGVDDRVEFVGAVPHTFVPEYLAKAKIAVLPNILQSPSQFSSPLKLFEYMASGTPVVASDIPVFREILIDGRNALLFEPGNQESLAKSIQKLGKDEDFASRLAACAKDTAQAFTYEKRAEKIISVIQTRTIKKQS